MHKESVIHRRSRYDAGWFGRLCCTTFIAWLLSCPASLPAATLTNTAFTNFVAAVGSGGTTAFAANGTVTFTRTIVVSNTAFVDATGYSVILSGNGAVRLFEVRSNASLTLINLSMANGSSRGTDGEAGGDGRDSSFEGSRGTNGLNGASAIGGAIFNQGNLTMIACKFTNNAATGGNGGDGGDGGNGDFKGGDGGSGGDGASARGGAVYNIGFTLITNCTFAGNVAVGGSGGTGGSGGSSPDPSTGHSGAGGSGAEGSGAAIYNAGGMRVYSSTFSSNAASGGDSKKAGVNGNGWFGNDGAIGGRSFGGGICSVGTLSMVNCTMALNIAKGGNGGDGGNGSADGGKGGNGGLASGCGIYSTSLAAITNCTIAANDVFGGTNGLRGSSPFPGSNGSMGESRGGNIANVQGTLFLANTILAYATNGGNVYGTVTDSGYNISSDKSASLTATGSLVNSDPKLNTLGDFSGPTQTMLPMPGSPAIDRGSAGDCLLFDQRGVSRPFGNTCDVGAVETSGLAILTHPKDQYVSVGAKAEFNVVAAGDPPFAYRWFFQLTNAIAGATNMTLTLDSAQSTNAGSYNVVVSNGGGTVTSSVATLRVLVATLLQLPAIQNGTNFSFYFSGTTGQTYVLEFKNTLTDSNWIPLKTNSSNGGLLTNLLPVNGSTSRFFRVVIQ